MDRVFDDICRIIAGPLSRRRAINLVAARLIPGLFLLRNRRATASGQPCDEDEVLCVGGFVCCNREREFCCGTPSGDICCDRQSAESCCANSEGAACCRKGELCCNGSGSPFCCDSSSPLCCYGSLGPNCCIPDTEDCCSGRCLPKDTACSSAGGADRGECEKCTLCCKGLFNFNCCLPEETCLPGMESLCCPPSKPKGCGPGGGGPLIFQKVDCCAANETCCQDRKGMRATCCTSAEECVNGVCNPLPTAFTGGGSGKFVSAAMGVSLLRLSVNGTGLSNASDPSSFSAVEDEESFSGDLQAFSYMERTLVQSTSLTDLIGTVRGENISLIGFGSAEVNGVPTQIAFRGTKTNGLIDFTISDVDSGQLIMSGRGEAGRAALDLSVTPI
jgi:hypothetical protein